MTTTTTSEFNREAAKCRSIFEKKNKDYGTAWAVLRLPSLIDQLFIKAKRIRSIEEQESQKVNDPVTDEFIGLVNYSVMALMQLNEQDKLENMPAAELHKMYDYYLEKAKELMLAKNHDYGEAWRDMYISSFTDLILMKLLRIRQIIENKGQTLISEGIDANLYDIINYAIFALIKTGNN